MNECFVLMDVMLMDMDVLIDILIFKLINDRKKYKKMQRKCSNPTLCLLEKNE